MITINDGRNRSGTIQSSNAAMVARRRPVPGATLGQREGSMTKQAVRASRFSLLASRFSLLASRFSLLASHFSLLASRFSLLASRFSCFC
jgi:hypothetical protein